MGVIGIEVIVALVGVLVTVPSAVFAIRNYLQQRKGQSRRSSTLDIPTDSECLPFPAKSNIDRVQI